MNYPGRQTESRFLSLALLLWSVQHRRPDASHSGGVYTEELKVHALKDTHTTLGDEMKFQQAVQHQLRMVSGYQSWHNALQVSWNGLSATRDRKAAFGLSMGSLYVSLISFGLSAISVVASVLLRGNSPH